MRGCVSEGFDIIQRGAACDGPNKAKKSTVQTSRPYCKINVGP